MGTIQDMQSTGGAIQVFDTTVMSTVLSNILELQNLTLYPQTTPQTAGTPEWGNLQQYLAWAEQIEGRQYWNGIDVIESASYTMPLRQALEELF